MFFKNWRQHNTLREAWCVNMFSSYMVNVNEEYVKDRCYFLEKNTTTNSFWQLLPKGEDLPFWERICLPFQKNHPLSEDRKFKLLLCMSLVFCALGNLSFNDDNHILKFFTEGFENLPSSFFLISKICYQV